MTLRRASRFWGVKGGASFVIPIQAEYQAVLDKATALGYTMPSSTQNQKNNAKVYYLKSIGIWALLDKIYVCNQESGLADFCTLNWVDPDSFQLNQSTPALKPTYTAGSGFESDGTQYFKTGFIPSTHAAKCLQTDGFMFGKSFGIPSTFIASTYLYGGRVANNNGQMAWLDNASGQVLNRIFNSQTISVAQADKNKHFFIVLKLGGITPTNENFRSQENGGFFSKGNTSIAGSKSTVENLFLAWNMGGTIQPAAQPVGISYLAIGGGMNDYWSTDISAQNAISQAVYQIMTETYVP